MQLVSRQANDYYSVPKAKYIRVITVTIKYLKDTYGKNPLTTYDNAIKAYTILLNKIKRNTSGRLYISKQFYNLYDKAINIFLHHKSEIDPTIEHDKNKIMKYAKICKDCYLSTNKTKSNEIYDIICDIDEVDGVSNKDWKIIVDAFTMMNSITDTSLGVNNLYKNEIISDFRKIRRIINPRSVSKGIVIKYVYKAYQSVINCNKSSIEKIIADVHNIDEVAGLRNKTLNQIKGLFNSFRPDMDFSDFLGSDSITGKMLKEDLVKLSKILNITFSFTIEHNPRVIAKYAAKANDMILNFSINRLHEINKIRLILFFINQIDGVSTNNLKNVKYEFMKFSLLSTSPDKTSLNLRSNDHFGSIITTIDNNLGVQYQSPEMKRRSKIIKSRNQKLHELSVKSHKRAVIDNLLTSHTSGCLISIILLFTGFGLLSKASYSGSPLSWIGGILFISSLIYAFLNSGNI